MRLWSILSLVTAMPLAPLAGAQEPTTAFVNVSVIPMDREQVLGNRTVLVRGSRIVALGSVGQVQVPAGAILIDGRGKFLIPGLADLHSHFPLDTSRMFAYLANGITTLRNPGQTDDNALAFRALVTAHHLLAPRLYVGSGYATTSPAAAAQSIVEAKAKGYDNVKLPVPNLPQELYDSIAAAAHRVHLRVVGHVQERGNIEAALRDRWGSIEHLTGYLEYLMGVSGHWTLDGVWITGNLNYQSFIDTAAWMKPTFTADSQIRAIAVATREAGVWNCPTLDATLAGVADLPDSVLAQMGFRGKRLAAWRATSLRLADLTFKMTKALQDVGAGLLLGTDEDAFAIHHELQLLVRAGLTPYQALVTGTRNAAIYLGTLDSTGTLVVGKRADMVLLAGNPLVDIGYTAGPVGVMVGGQWIPRTEIDARLSAMGLENQQRLAWQHSPTPRTRK